MPSQNRVTDHGRELDQLALAFVVQVQGSWTPEALQSWGADLQRQGHTVTDEDVAALAERARQQFATGAAQFFLCAGRPCRQRQKFDASAAALQQAAVVAQVMITPTECQGPCKHAPVATLRIGQRSDMFAQFIRERDWQTVMQHVQRAVAAGTLLVSLGEAQAFHFDPVHDHDSANGPLQRLQFLLGHFQGIGLASDGSECFQKEAIGAWEVGGRFLALRMGVTYPLANGQKDTHTALAMIGVHPDNGELMARVYTDGGSLHDFQLSLEGDTLMFADRAEVQHGTQAKRARKVFTPTAYGFEERLELDRGSGQFTTYYTVAMHRPEAEGSHGA
jgi:hypothetical protein